MADNSFETIFSVEFEDFSSVKNKLESLKKKIGSSNTSGIKIDVDTTQINKIIENVNKLSKSNIQILPNGQIKAISTFNDEIGKTVKLTNDLATGNTKIDITEDYAKQLKAKQQEEKDLNKMEEARLSTIRKRVAEENKLAETQAKAININKDTEYIQEQKMIEEMANKREQSEARKQNAIKKTEEAQIKAINSNKDKSYLEEQKMIEQMATKRENSEIRRQNAIIKSEELQAKAINKEIESARVEEQKAKEEMINAQKLIEIEKQKLQIKQKNIELNRGSLIDTQKSKSISTGINGLSGNTIKEVRDNASKLSLELQKLDQSARMKGVSVGQKNVQSLGDAFKSTASKLGIFASTAMVIRQLGQEIKQATEYIIAMDTSLTNIMMITGKTQSQVSSIINEFKSLGTELHTTNKEIMNSSEEILRAGYDTETSKKMLEASVIGSKVSGQTSQQVTEQLIAVKNAFNMTGDELDGVIDKMAEMDRTSATSFQELANATKQTAFSAQEMGTSFSDLLAYITTVSEKTRKTPETIGESFKTIYARYSNIKLGNLDEDGKSINDVEKALGRLNIKLRDGEGSFRDFDVVLKEFMDMSNSGNISKVDKLAVVQALAGTRQKETLLALIENTDALAKHQEDLANSTGMAKEMFDNAYAESLDAKINDLKRSFEGLYESMLNSSTLKFGLDISTTTISGVTQLAKTFGTLPLIITGVVGALTIFNSKMRENASIYASLIPGVGKFNVSLSELGVKLSTNIEAYKREILIGKEFVVASNQAGVSTKTLGLNLLGLNAKLSLATVGLMATKVATVALNSVISMGLSLAITWAISGLTNMISKLTTTKDSMGEATTKVKELNEATKNMNDMDSSLKQYEIINKKLQDTNLTTEERNELEQKGNELKETMIGIDSEAGSILENNNFTLETKVGLMRELVKLKQQEKADEMDEELSRGSFFGGKSIEENKVQDASVSMEYNIQQYKKIIELQKEAQGKDIEFGGSTLNLEQQNKALDEFGKKVTSQYSKIALFNSQVQGVIDANGKSSVPLFELSENMETFVQDLLSGKATVDNTVDGINHKLATMGDETQNDSVDIKTQAMQNSLEALGLTAEEVKKKMGEIGEGGFDSPAMLETATKSFSDTTSEIDTLYGMIEKINEAGSMTPQIMSEIAGKYNDVGSAVFNTSTAQEFLNGKIADMKNTQSEAIQIMRGNDSVYFNELLSNGDSLQQSFDALASNYVDTQSSAYDYDVNNYGTLNEAKEGMTQQLSKVLAQSIANFTNGNASEYEKDLQSFTSLAQMKVYTVQKLDDQIAKVQGNYENLITRTKAIKSLSNVGSKSMSADIAKRLGLGSTNDLLSNVTNELDNLKSERQRVETSFSEFNRSFSKSIPNFSGADYKNGSKSGGKNGSGSKSATEKQVEDIENLADRYYDLNEKLKSVEIAFKKIDTIMENGTDKQKIKSLKEQVALYNKKREVLQNFLKEQQKESSSDRGTLGKAGFKFNVDGSISNYAEKMKALQQWANSRSNPNDKQSAQDYYKEMSKLTEEYFDLIKDKIPDTQNQIENIKNEVISAQKEVADILEKQRDKYIDNLEKETDKLKTELSRRKELMEKSWEQEDEKDELSEKQTKLNQLKADLASALRSGDESLAYSIKQQIAEAQKEMNDFINKSERDKASDMFDEEEKRIDEELQAKIDMIESQLGDEDILKLVQQGVTDLSTTLNNIDSTTNGVNRSFMLVGDTVTNIGTTIGTTWSSGLDKIIEKAQKLASIFSNPLSTDMDVSKNSIASKQNNEGKGNTIIIKPGEIVINGANKDDIRKEIDEMGDKIYDQVMNTLDH